MNIKRIIFLARATLNQRDFKRFGIELLQENGFQVEFWDGCPVLEPELFKAYVPPDPFVYSGLKTFNNKDKLYAALSALGNDDFVFDLINFDLKFLRVYRALTKSEANYAVLMTNALPNFSDIDELMGIKLCFRKIKTFFRLSPYELWKAKIVPRLPPAKVFGIKPAKFILAGGAKCLQHNFPVDETTEVIWTHTLDYDLFLQEKDDSSKVEEMAVFLDSYILFDSYWECKGIDSGINTQQYYEDLNALFDSVEKNLEVEVVIAAHPRSNYENMPDYFKGRRCIRGATVKLVKKSKLVLAHSSTAITFANLFYKPLIFITTDDLERSLVGPSIQVMAAFHGKTPTFVDNNVNVNWAEELKVKVEYYESYRRAYIKTENSPDLPLWQIVAERLKNI